MSVASFIAAQRTEHRCAPREVLPVAGGERVVVLQVARPATDRPPAAPGRARRGGEGVVR